MAVNLRDLIDIDLLAYFKSKLDLLFAGKVDKIDGKGLSSNDYTDADELKLSGIAVGAQANVIEGIQKNGSSISPVNKIVNIPVPEKTSDITNDSGFITSSDVPTATSTTPKMDGTAAVGSEATFAKGDHVHPSDSTKVDKVAGKGLSTNDYTTEEQTKLAGIAAGAEVNVVTNASSSGSGAAETVTVSKGSTNYVMYSKNAIDQKLVGAMNYKGTKATTSALPSTGNAQGDVWHVTADGSEWAWNGSTWEELGTAVDLSGYVEESDLGLATTTDIDDLFT